MDLSYILVIYLIIFIICLLVTYRLKITLFSSLTFSLLVSWIALELLKSSSKTKINRVNVAGALMAFIQLLSILVVTFYAFYKSITDVRVSA